MEHRFFEILPQETKIDFAGRFNKLLIFSMGLIAISLGSLAIRGLDYGVDFKGGTEVHVKFKGEITADNVRKALGTIGLAESVVQGVGDETGEYLIRVESAELNLTPHKDAVISRLGELGKEIGKEPSIRFSEDRIYVSFGKEADPEKIKSTINQLHIQDVQAEIVQPFGKAENFEYLVQFAGVSERMVSAFEGSFGKGKFEVLQIEQVGPKVGADLRKQALGAILISLLFIMIYVWFRFEFVFAPGAILSLAHDAILVLGLFSIFRLKFDVSIVAALLTIVGYSINDTIVLYDRVRENMRKSRDTNLAQILNLSINQTLARTVLTSTTVLIASVTLAVFGGPITFNFALAFTFGVFTGTYSSAFIAAPISVYLDRYLQNKHQRK